MRGVNCMLTQLLLPGFAVLPASPPSSLYHSLVWTTHVLECVIPEQCHLLRSQLPKGSLKTSVLYSITSSDTTSSAPPVRNRQSASPTRALW